MRRIGAGRRARRYCWLALSSTRSLPVRVLLFPSFFPPTLTLLFLAEILVDVVDVVLDGSGIPEKFLGVTLFALVPNTTEFMNGQSSSFLFAFPPFLPCQTDPLLPKQPFPSP
jgi:hypothetical protein